MNEQDEQFPKVFEDKKPLAQPPKLELAVAQPVGMDERIPLEPPPKWLPEPYSMWMLRLLDGVTVGKVTGDRCGVWIPGEVMDEPIEDVVEWICEIKPPPQ